MRTELRILVTTVVLTSAHCAFAGQAAPCGKASAYPGPEPGLLATVAPLTVRRVEGRAVVDTQTRNIPVDQLGEACLSLFTEDGHRFVASAATDGRGHFAFPPVPPGRYRLVARMADLCTSKTLIEVDRTGKAKGLPILVHFRVRQVDVCSYANYDTTPRRRAP